MLDRILIYLFFASCFLFVRCLSGKGFGFFFLVSLFMAAIKEKGGNGQMASHTAAADWSFHSQSRYPVAAVWRLGGDPFTSATDESQ